MDMPQEFLLSGEILVPSSVQRIHSGRKPERLRPGLPWERSGVWVGQTLFTNIL